MPSARLSRILFAVLCCLLIRPTLTAQKFAVEKITFAGYPAATQTELLTASGLKAGAPLGQPEIQAAAQRLSDTGLFSNVEFASTVPS